MSISCKAGRQSKLSASAARQGGTLSTILMLMSCGNRGASMSTSCGGREAHAKHFDLESAGVALASCGQGRAMAEGW